VTRLRRDAITRARFFLLQARSCPYRADLVQYEMFEAYLEASIVFSRAAINRLHKSAVRRAKGNPSLKAEWDDWWHSILNDPAIQFFRDERNFILKEGPPMVGQIVRMGGPPQKMEDLYYYESPDIPATDTIERHLNSVEKLVTDAERRFGTSSLSGRWWED
jgi:hypothetical protein